MHYYETDEKLSKILLAVFVVAFVFPFLVVQILTLVGPSDYIVWKMPLRIQGVLDMRSIEKPPQVRLALTPLPEGRTPRIQGVWNMRMGGIHCVAGRFNQGSMRTHFRSKNIKPLSICTTQSLFSCNG